MIENEDGIFSTEDVYERCKRLMAALTLQAESQAEYIKVQRTSIVKEASNYGEAQGERSLLQTRNGTEAIPDEQTARTVGRATKRQRGGVVDFLSVVRAQFPFIEQVVSWPETA